MITPLIRFGIPGDLNFIFSSWLKSHRDIFKHENMDGTEFSAKDLELRKQMKERHDQTKFMKNVSYFSSYKKHITNLLTKSQVLVAVDPTKPELIYGFLVFEPLPDRAIICHYGYTKHVYRKLGVMRGLIDEALKGHKPRLIVLTIHNLVVSELRSKHPELLVYDPYILE